MKKATGGLRSKLRLTAWYITIFPALFELSSSHEIKTSRAYENNYIYVRIYVVPMVADARYDSSAPAQDPGFKNVYL